VTAATDGTAATSQQHEDDADYDQDDSDRPQERDTGYQADDQQNRTQNDHSISLYITNPTERRWQHPIVADLAPL
jgi:hypothetical protein